MFVQIIQGKVKDPDLIRRQMERWRAELRSGATGFLGSTGGTTPDGRSITLARFESEDAARANSGRPEQSAWWQDTAQAYDGEPTFHDCREADEILGGGSDDAGFVQVIQGRAKDQQRMRTMAGEMEGELRKRRPDVLGGIVAWHGDGGFTQAVYFTSQEEARRREKETEQDELGQEFMSLIDGEPEFFDLTEPELD